MSDNLATAPVVAGAGTLAFYVERQSIEWPLTLNILQSIPTDRLDYTPHPASPTPGSICATLIRCLGVCVALMDASDVEMVFETGLQKTVLVERYRHLSESLHSALGTRDQRFWEAQVTVRAQGTPVLEHSRGEILWLFLFDAIHHRGQLSTYLRPMGSTVPSIYGKSADGNH